MHAPSSISSNSMGSALLLHQSSRLPSYMPPVTLTVPALIATTTYTYLPRHSTCSSFSPLTTGNPSKIMHAPSSISSNSMGSALLLHQSSRLPSYMPPVTLTVPALIATTTYTYLPRHSTCSSFSPLTTSDSSKLMRAPSFLSSNSMGSALLLYQSSRIPRYLPSATLTLPSSIHHHYLSTKYISTSEIQEALYQQTNAWKHMTLRPIEGPPPKVYANRLRRS